MMTGAPPSAQTAPSAAAMGRIWLIFLYAAAQYSRWAQSASGRGARTVRSRAEEHPVRGVAGLLDIGVVQLIQVLQELRPRGRRHLDARGHAAMVRTVIAIVEQADVPACADRLQEFQQRPGAFGKLEAIQHLIADAT